MVKLRSLPLSSELLHTTCTMRTLFFFSDVSNGRCFSKQECDRRTDHVIGAFIRCFLYLGLTAKAFRNPRTSHLSIFLSVKTLMTGSIVPTPHNFFWWDSSCLGFIYHWWQQIRTRDVCLKLLPAPLTNLATTLCEQSDVRNEKVTFLSSSLLLSLLTIAWLLLIKQSNLIEN